MVWYTCGVYLIVFGKAVCVLKVHFHDMLHTCISAFTIAM